MKCTESGRSRREISDLARGAIAGWAGGRAARQLAGADSAGSRKSAGVLPAEMREPESGVAQAAERLSSRRFGELQGARKAAEGRDA